SHSSPPFPYTTLFRSYVEPDLFLDLFNRVGPDGHVALLSTLETHRKKGRSKFEEAPKDLLPGWTSAWATRWTAMEPALAETDLRSEEHTSELQSRFDL